MDRLQRQFDFIREIDKEKEITRQNYLASGNRKEGDAEHAWHLAIMALLLREHANEEVDVLKTMSMVLIHDLVEIDAGDTYAYDDSAKLSQHDREQVAADRIFGLLPEDQARELRALWDEFEAGETPEAKFARALDRVQPLMLNSASGGISWVEHGVKKSQILKRNEATAQGSTAIWEYARRTMLDPHVGDTVIDE